MTIDLNAIKERCEALDNRMSEGPWTLESSGRYPGLFSVYDGDGNVVSHGVEEEQAFITHARADVPALVAEVERLRHKNRVRGECLAVAMGALDWYGHNCPVLLCSKAGEALDEIEQRLAQLEPEEEAG